MAHEVIFFNGSLVGLVVGLLAYWRLSIFRRKACLNKHVKKTSQCYQVHQHICSRGLTLTKSEAKKLYGVANLSSLISVLNKAGSNIRTVNSNVHGNYYSL